MWLPLSWGFGSTLHRNDSTSQVGYIWWFLLVVLKGLVVNPNQPPQSSWNCTFHNISQQNSHILSCTHALVYPISHSISKTRHQLCISRVPTKTHQTKHAEWDSRLEQKPWNKVNLNQTRGPMKVGERVGGWLVRPLHAISFTTQPYNFRTSKIIVYISASVKAPKKMEKAEYFYHLQNKNTISLDFFATKNPPGTTKSRYALDRAHLEANAPCCNNDSVWKEENPWENLSARHRISAAWNWKLNIASAIANVRFVVAAKYFFSRAAITSYYKPPQHVLLIAFPFKMLLGFLCKLVNCKKTQVNPESAKK